MYSEKDDIDHAFKLIHSNTPCWISIICMVHNREYRGFKLWQTSEFFEIREEILIETCHELYSEGKHRERICTACEAMVFVKFSIRTEPTKGGLCPAVGRKIAGMIMKIQNQFCFLHQYHISRNISTTGLGPPLRFAKQLVPPSPSIAFPSHFLFIIVQLFHLRSFDLLRCI